MSLINSTPRATSLNTLQNGSDPARGNVVCGFDTVAGFEAIQRMANLFSASSIVPENYPNIASRRASILSPSLKISIPVIHLFSSIATGIIFPYLRSLRR